MINYIDENLGKINKIFKGELVELEKFKFKISDLKFNPHNTRIIDIIESEYGSGIFDSKEIWSDEVQVLIMKSLVKTHGDDLNKELLVSINRGITEPFAITEDGYVLSGNNRLSLIRANMGNDGFNYNKHSYVDGVLIKGPLSTKDINDWELSFQNENNIQKEYEQMNIILKTKMLREKGTTIQDILKITKYKQESNINEALEIEDLYRDLLLFAGVPNAVELHRKIPMYSSLHALVNFKKNQNINSEMASILQNIYFKTILATNIPVQKLRSDLFSNFITKPNISPVEKIKLLEEIETSFEEKINSTFVENKQNKFDESKLKIIDFSKDEKGLKTLFNEVSYEVSLKAKEILNNKDESYATIIKKIAKSAKLIDEILNIPNLAFEGMEISEIDSLEKELLKLEEIINKAKNKVNGR